MSCLFEFLSPCNYICLSSDGESGLKENDRATLLHLLVVLEER